MTTAAALVVFAIAVATLGRRVLAELTDRTAYPLLGVLAWLVACGAVVVSGIGAGLLAAGLHLPAMAANVVDACLTLARQSRNHTHVSVPAIALPLVAAAAVRGVWAAGSGYAAVVRLRRRHLQALRLVGHTDRELGAIVVDAPQPAVYCLDGRRRTIVVTTTALGALTGRQLAAVLDHERCHLAERHHLVTRMFQLLARAFPFVPVFRQARTRVWTLLEMRADDIAARRHGRGVVAAALAAVGTAAIPPAALVAGGPSAVARARRLLDTPRPSRKRWLLLTVIATNVTGPFASLLIPFCGA